MCLHVSGAVMCSHLSGAANTGAVRCLHASRAEHLDLPVAVEN